jgi:hypothetical protein
MITLFWKAVFYYFCRAMRVISFLVLFLLIYSAGLGQDLDGLMFVQPQWVPGKVTLREGEMLAGDVCYDDLRGVVYYRSEWNEPKKIYTSNDVVHFEFADKDVPGGKRVFYTFDFADPQKNVERPLFFEVIREFEQFAVLLKIDPAEFNQQVGSRRSALQQQTTMQQSGHVMRAQQIQTLCFMNTEGKIEPYILLEIREIDGVFADRVRNKHKTQDKTLPEKYFGKPSYQKMRQYARENDLDLDDLSDFVKVVTYYAEHLYTKA